MKKNYFESIIYLLFEELYCSTIVHMNHMEPMFQDLPNFFHFRPGGRTHFLVLAQILIYSSRRKLQMFGISFRLHTK